MTYTVPRNNTNMLQMYVNFTRKHVTEINSRDTVKNPMQMFKSKNRQPMRTAAKYLQHKHETS